LRAGCRPARAFSSDLSMTISSRVRRNVAANLGGGVWSGLMSLVFIPLYVHFLGIEAYGLVGFFITLQSLFALLDLGLSTTLNRELARLSAAGTEDARAGMRDLLRTVEIIYCSIAVLIGAVIMALAHTITVRWINVQHLPLPTVERAVVLMGVIAAAQWPLGLYSGGLQGLQEQVELNVINAGAATLRGGGAVLVLWLLSPTIVAFFAWQVVVSLVQTAACALYLWRSVGGGAVARFNAAHLRGVWRFAVGMMAISFLSVALTQMDKIVLSRLLPLATFGYYAVAAAVAASLYRIITPVFTALFPRFSQIVAARDPGAEASLYHRASQLTVVVVAPAAIFVAAFASEVLNLWTRNGAIAGNAHTVLTLLILGTAVNGIMTIPYAVQLAHGWTRLSAGVNIVAVVLIAPALYFGTSRYGPAGAAAVWLAYNVIGALVVAWLMHRRLLQGERRRWLLRDVAAPLILPALIALAARPLVWRTAGATQFAALALIALLMQLFALLTLSDVRQIVRRFVLRYATA
jgi:O-antigen/teichoic acid export membrane protein